MLISHSVEIATPAERVWATLVDVERWPEFAPQFKSIARRKQGPFGIGSSARVTPHGFPGSVWTVTDYQEGHHFTWEGSMLPGMHLTGGHEVVPSASGSRLTLWLRSEGPTSILLLPVLGRIFRRNVRQEGEGLKAYLEKTP